MMDKHEKVILYLDRDKAGMKLTAQAIKDNPRYKNGSVLYPEQNDLNQWLINNYVLLQQQARKLNRAKKIAQDINKNHPGAVTHNREKGRRI